MRQSKYIRALLDPVRALRIINRRYLQIGVSSPDPEVRLMNGWPYGALPRVKLKDCFPGIDNAGYRLVNAFDRTENMSMTVFELNVLLAVQIHLAARRILEIGTFDGGTTVNMAANLAPDGIITTIDLPPSGTDLELKVSAAHDNSSDPKIVGRQFIDTEMAQKINQVYGDSAVLDFDALDGPYDLVYIDGCHDYSYVKSDTEKALRALSPNGAIIWHDYSMIPDVARYVDELADSIPIKVIQGTRLAIHYARWS